MQQYIYSFLFLTLFFGIFNTLIGQQSLQNRIETLSKDADLKHAILGLTVLDVESGEVVFGHNQDICLKPASTLKVVTTSTALGVLGSDFQFETHLQYDGYIDKDSTLHGNLFLKGGGDPTLGFMRKELNPKLSEVLEMWVNAVKNAGIKQIKGYVIGDASIYESGLIPPKWTWEDMGNYYGAGASGLNLHENKYSIQFKTGQRAGDATSIKHISPSLPGLTFENEVKTGKMGSGDEAIVYASPYTDHVIVRGTVPPRTKEFTIKGAVPDPSFFAAQNLLEALLDAGIEVNDIATTLRRMNGQFEEKKRTTIHTFVSPPLKDIVYWANKKSINIYCESLLKMIGYKLYGRGTTVHGLEGVMAYWLNRGINLTGFFMRDGSGLSPENSVSTHHLAQILRMAQKEDYYQDFDYSLSYAGVPCSAGGSLRGQLVGTKAQNNLRAKSGYIERVRSYSGYAKSRSGKLLSFSVIANNYTCSNAAMRNKLMQVLKAIAEIQ